MEPDFSGWATVAGLKCSDGRTIMPDAFAHMDKMQVPLVYQHGHTDLNNVLGHVMLENQTFGVRANGYFNTTTAGQNAKLLVQHKDIDSLSIYANQLVEKAVSGAKQVVHGVIREVSLVLSGANPKAKIDFVAVQHGDGSMTELEDEAVIHTGLKIGEEPPPATPPAAPPAADDKKDDKTVVHADGADSTPIVDIYNALSDQQKNVVAYMIGQALQAQTAQHSNNAGDGKEGQAMGHNVFDQTGKDAVVKHELTHDAVAGILADAKKPGATLQSAVGDYALAHGIDQLDILFPEAQTLNNTPDWNKRRTEWVAGVLNGTRKSPFSRVKSIVADITQDEARALGYIKGHYKKDEWFSLRSRITTPTTVYKKQTMDRDDVVDITGFDVIAWLKGEMRLMLEEELARAILLGDGRDPSSEDKIKDPGSANEGAGIRAIVNENELYATTVNVNLGATPNYYELVKAVKRSRRFFKGTGTPTFYTTSQTLVEMLLTEDSFGRPRWETPQALAAALMVDQIVEVEVMDSTDYADLFGIIVNLADYNVGADKGGEVNLFDDFDIDYNQYKYLIETRISGALVKIKSAIILKKVADSTDTEVLPTDPTYNKTTFVVTVPAKTGVVYKNADTNATLTAGAQTALTAGQTLNIKAVPAADYYFANNAEDQWTFFRRS